MSVFICMILQKKWLQEDNKGISSEIHKPIKQLHAQETHTQSPCTTNTDCPTSQAASREQPLPASGNLGRLFTLYHFLCNSGEGPKYLLYG